MNDKEYNSYYRLTISKYLVTLTRTVASITSCLDIQQDAASPLHAASAVGQSLPGWKVNGILKI